MARNNTTRLRDSFLFRRVWGEMLALLPDEDAGKVFKAVYGHTKGQSASKVLGDDQRLQCIAGEIIRDLEKRTRAFLDRKNRKAAYAGIERRGKDGQHKPAASGEADGEAETDGEDGSGLEGESYPATSEETSGEAQGDECGNQVSALDRFNLRDKIQ